MNLGCHNNNVKNQFIPGLKLAELFYTDVVKDLLLKYYPELQYTAALLGRGSEVIGFDDETSSDHNWGPRLILFLGDRDYNTYKSEIIQLFRKRLPYSFFGYSTNFSEPDPNDPATILLEPITEGLINHRIEVYSLKIYLKLYLNVNSLDLTEKDWLFIPEQRLLEFTSGKVFFDGIGDLTSARTYLKYYPKNVWHFKILAQWESIGQEIAFIGRPGMIGDDLGSRIETARLVRYMMGMALLLAKKYVPYQKWFGLAFKQLELAKKLEPLFLNVLKEKNWKKREEYICEAALLLLEEQNTLKIAEEVIIEPIQFHDRPQMVIDVEKIQTGIKKILKPPLRDVKHPVGSINQITDMTTILEDPQFIFDWITKN